MHADEFILLFLWVLAPPLFVGFVLLRLLAAGAAVSLTKRLWTASMLLAWPGSQVWLAFFSLCSHRLGLAATLACKTFTCLG